MADFAALEAVEIEPPHLSTVHVIGDRLYVARSIADLTEDVSAFCPVYE